MVYIHFPSNLTEEELMLQTKYQKLKKKKKALHALKTPKQEQEKPLMAKRPADARDAREVARKLLKSGAIQAIQKPQTKQDQTSFKRPKGQERKRPAPESNTSIYQPFSATQEEGFQGTNESGERESSSRIHNLYQQFATERDREERGLTDVKKPSDIPTTNSGQRPEKQKAKNTICISGASITEEYIRHHFGTFGTLINVSMEIEKGRGFVTFSKPESSERAINEMHSKTIGGISLQIQLARRQPKIEPINDATSSPVWASVAATSHSQKGNLKDTREQVVYDDNFFDE